MIALVRIALRRPYTFVVLALLILIIGPLAALRTPTDIFPDIRIPVISVVWQYTGLPPDQMAGRITTPFQRALTTTVNDIEHIEANSYNGFGIIKIFFQPNVDIRTANAQVTAISQTLIKQMPPGATPPLILNYNASTVPIMQVALSGEGFTEQKLADIGINQVRTPLGHRAGAAIPYPFGGKLAADPDRPRPRRAAGARPVGSGRRQRARGAEPDHAGRNSEKIGAYEYAIQLNNAPSQVGRRSAISPIKTVNGAMVYVRDVAQVRDGNAPQTNIVHVDGNRSVLLQVLKNGSVSTLAIIAGVKQRLIEIGRRCRRTQDLAARRPVDLRARRDRGRRARRRHRRRADQPDDPAVPRQLALDRDHRDVDPAGDARLDHRAVGARRDAEHHDARRAGAGGRHPRRRRDGDDREHQLASRTRQGGRTRDHGRRAPDRDAGLRLAAVHLHRLRADVLPRRRRPLPVRADGRSGDVRDDLFVHSVAHARADDGELSAEAARPNEAGHSAQARSRNPLVLFQQGFEAGFERLRAGYRDRARTGACGGAPSSSSAFSPSSAPRSC